MKQKILMVAYLVMAFVYAKAQPVITHFTGNPSNNYTVTLNGGYPIGVDSRTTQMQANHTPVTTIILEYGDGNFTTLFNSKYYYANNITSNITPFAVATAYYDSTRRPREYAISTPPTYGTTTALQTVLQTNEYVHISPHATTVVPGEITHFVASYSNTKSLTMIFYNKKTSVLFKRINGAGNSMTVNNQNINLIRAITPQQKVFTNKIDLLNSSDFTNSFSQAERTLIQNKYNQETNATGSYKEDVIFILNTGGDGSAKNFFFSLLPVDAVDYNQVSDSNTVIKAYCYTGDIDNGIDKTYLTNLTLSAFAHDPNFITVNPPCIKKDSVKNKINYHKTLSYKIHFQNTGLAAVTSKLRITVLLPQGMRATLSNISGTLGNTKYNAVKLVSGNNLVLYNNSMLYTIKSSTKKYGKDTLTIWFTKPYLIGMIDNPNGLLNPLTSGHVDFSLTTTSAAQYPLNVTAKIFFNDESPVAVQKIICGDCSVKKCAEKPYYSNLRIEE